MFEGPVTGNIPEVLDNGEVTDGTHVTAGQLALALTPYAQVTELAVNTAASGNNAAAIQSLDAGSPQSWPQSWTAARWRRQLRPWPRRRPWPPRTDRWPRTEAALQSAGGVPLSRRPGHGDGLEHRRRAAQLLHHRTSRRPPRRQARSHGGGLGPANSRALSGRRRGRRAGGRHRRADPGPHRRLTVKLDGSPQQRLQRHPGHAHRGSERGRLHSDPGGEPVEHCAHLQLDARPRAPGRQRLRPIVRQLRGRRGRLEHGQDVLHRAAKRSGEAAHFQAPGLPNQTAGTVDVYGDGGADDVTLATLGEVLLEPTLTTLAEHHGGGQRGPAELRLSPSTTRPTPGTSPRWATCPRAN